MILMICEVRGTIFEAKTYPFSWVCLGIAPETPPRCPKTPPRRSKTRQRCSKNAPRRPQDVPRRHKTSQDAPTTRPRRPQDAPRNRKKRVLKALRSGIPSRLWFRTVSGWILEVFLLFFGGFWGRFLMVLRYIFWRFLRRRININRLGERSERSDSGVQKY